MRRILIAAIVFFIFAIVTFTEERFKVIQTPFPTSHGLKDAITLKTINSVEELSNVEIPAFDEILSATVDSLGNFYFFDNKHSAIIKLDKNLTFVTSFGTKGEGPGEFKTPHFASPIFLTAGLDQHLYYASLMGRKIMKFAMDGKYIATFKVEQFKSFKPAVDEKGRIFLTSSRDKYVFEVFDKQMNPIKELVPNSLRSTFLFFPPPDCVLHRLRVPDCQFMMYQFLTNGDLLALNNLDLSIMVIDKNSGAIKKQFYAWDEYMIVEFQLRLKATQKKIEDTGATCGYNRAIASLFVDNCDDIYLTFIDSKKNKFIFNYALSGDLKKVYRINSPLASSLHFFHVNNGQFYAFSRYSVNVFAR